MKNMQWEITHIPNKSTVSVYVWTFWNMDTRTEHTGLAAVSLMQETGMIPPPYAYSMFLPSYLFCDHINSQSHSTTVEKLRLCWVYTATQKSFSWSFRTQTAILQLVVPKYKALHSALSQRMLLRWVNIAERSNWCLCSKPMGWVQNCKAMYQHCVVLTLHLWSHIIYYSADACMYIRKLLQEWVLQTGHVFLHCDQWQTKDSQQFRKQNSSRLNTI